MTEDFIEEIYKNKRYKEIIKHQNFNPRIIEFITDSTLVEHLHHEDYWKHIIKSLNKPEVIWADYFQNQTDDCVRALTFLTVFNKGKIAENTLRNAYNTFLKIHPVNLGDHSDKSFEAVRKLATKSLLNRNQIDENKFEYVLFNPSIADFILSVYSEEIDLICNIIKSLETEVSIDFLHALFLSNKINSSNSDRILEDLFEYFFESKLNEEDWDFLITLSYCDFLNDRFRIRIEQFLNILINAYCPKGYRLWELLMILLDFEPEIEFKNFKFLYNFIEDVEDEDTLKILLDFVDRYDIEDKNILMQIEILIENYLQNIIDNNDLDIDYKNHLNYSFYPDGYPKQEIDFNGIENEIRDILDFHLEEFNVNVLEKSSFNTHKFASNMDIETMVIRFFESYEPYYEPKYDIGSYSRGSNEDDIDALFER